MITRGNAEALIPQQVSDEIIKALPTASVFLSMARQMPRMTSKQTKIPVMTGLATASFISGDTGKKPTSNLTWDNVYITAEELAVIIPIPEAVLDDSNYDIWGEARPRIVEAFAKAIDAAAFFGIGKPDTWPEGIVSAAIAAGNVVSLYPGYTGPDLYTKVLGEDGVLAKVEETGVGSTGFVGAQILRAKLRGALDNNGQPIFRASYSNSPTNRMLYDLEGQPIVFPNNGAWDPTAALLLAGNFDYARYAIRQDITFKIFDQGTITDSEGKVALSLMENDCVAMRAVMRLGWALPKPVNPMSGVNYYPFSVLQPSSASEIGALNFNVTAPVKGATPQASHDSGDGYTAEITWNPADVAFAGSTAYTATVVFTAAEGHIFEDSISKADIQGLPATSGGGKAATSVNVTRDSNTQVTVVVKYVATGA